MAENVRSIAAKLGARVVARLPDTGGGAFGAARLGRIASTLQSDALPVPVADVTLEKLIRLAEKASTAGRLVGPAEVAARLLEEAVAAVPDV